MQFLIKAPVRCDRLQKKEKRKEKSLLNFLNFSALWRRINFMKSLL